MSKKILYLRTDIYHERFVAGGSISHTIGVITGFKEIGYHVICASSVLFDELKTIALDKLIHLKNPACFLWIRWRLNCLLSNVFFTYRIMTLVQQEKPVFLYQRYSFLNFTGIIAQAMTKIPLVLEYNGSEVWVEQHWVTKRKFFRLSVISRLIEYWNIRYARFIVVVSEVLKNELMNKGIKPEKILVNPNGVNITEFDPVVLENNRKEIRTHLLINDKIVFGFIGTFSFWHGIDILVQLAQKLTESYKNIHFLFIGDGPLMESLKNNLHHCKEYITYTGILPSSKARSYLAACDIFLSPTQPNDDGSPFFGSPTKLFEYMSLAKPIIASQLGQINEILSPFYKLEFNNFFKVNDEVGILVNPKESDQFYTAAQLLLNAQDDELQKMGNNARIKAINHYQWKDHVKKIISFVESQL